MIKYNSQQLDDAVTGDDKEDGKFMYDQNGNMIDRNGATLYYDAANRLTAYTNTDRKIIESYKYDYTGHRIMKMNAEDVKTYNIDNLYEVSVYKYSKIHTKYILGLNNELVAQATSENATLVTAHDPAVINKQYNTDTVSGSVRYVYSMASYLVWQSKYYRNAIFILTIILIGGTIFIIVSVLFASPLYCTQSGWHKTRNNKRITADATREPVTSTGNLFKPFFFAYFLFGASKRK